MDETAETATDRSSGDSAAADGDSAAVDGGESAGAVAEADASSATADEATTGDDESGGVVIDLDADHREPPSPSALRGVETRILALDGALGALLLAVGLAARPPGALRSQWWLLVPAAVVTVAVLYADERDAVAGREAIAEEHRRAALLGALAALAIAVGVTQLGGPASAAASAFLVGVGLGTLCYRLAFGVVLPVPRPRVRRAQRLRWLVAETASAVGRRIRG